MSWSISELRVRLAPLNRFKPSGKIFYRPIQGGTSFVEPLCFCTVLCLLCLCGRLFIFALWSPARKGLASWLSFVVSNCEFVTFPFDILRQVWYLIVSILDLCTLTYFLGWTSSKLGELCLVQWQIPVMLVKLEPAASRSPVKHFTTEPLLCLQGSSSCPPPLNWAIKYM